MRKARGIQGEQRVNEGKHGAQEREGSGERKMPSVKNTESRQAK